METLTSLYGLRYNPFSLAARSLENRFLSTDFREALSRAGRTAEEMGVCILTGDPGFGVSFAAGCAARDLEKTRITVRHMTADRVEVRDTLKKMCRTVGADPYGKTKEVLLGAIREKGDMLAEQGRPLFLIIDNAQHLPGDILGDMPSLLASDYPARARMMFMLCGTPDLQKRLSRSMGLRVTDFYKMTGLQKEEAVPYVLHMLKAAGARDALLEKDAEEILYEYSAGGNFRVLNNVMRDALYLGCSSGRGRIDRTLILSSAAHQYCS